MAEMTLQEAAQAAIDEYNEAYKNGGELPYPVWADKALKVMKALREQEKEAV